MKAIDFKKALTKQRPPRTSKPSKSLANMIESLYMPALFWGRNDQWKEGEITFVLPCLMPGLNGDDGLMRLHFSKSEKLKDAVIYAIRKQLPPKKPLVFTGKVEIRYIRYCVRESTMMDWDNASASFKHIGDALVKCGVIKDDNPRIVKRFTPEQEISETKKAYTIIQISPYVHTI